MDKLALALGLIVYPLTLVPRTVIPCLNTVAVTYLTLEKQKNPKTSYPLAATEPRQTFVCPPR